MKSRMSVKDRIALGALYLLAFGIIAVVTAGALWLKGYMLHKGWSAGG